MSAITRLFGAAAPKPPPVPQVVPAPTPEDPAVEEARQREIRQARAAKGRSSTLVTGGLGDTSEAPVVRKRLLGE